MAEIIQLPENGGSAGFGNIPFSIPIGGGNGMFGNGQTNLMDLLGFAIVASIFPNFFGGRGFGQGQGQFPGMNTDIVMQAVTAQGEASRTAIQTLASSIGQDFNIVYGAVSGVQNMLSNLALQQAVSVPQLINAIQSGDSNLASQLAQCCCENRLLTTQQGYEAQIRTLEQTNVLGSQADRNAAAIRSDLAAMQTNITKEFCDIREREMQAKIDTQADIITQLRGQLDNDRQTAQLFAAINPLQAKVNEIAAKQPNTVPVQYPNLVAVNQTPYNGGIYPGYGYGGYGFGGF